ncbi:MAG: GIY-YIG nuclease family protein [Eubacteriaceae bacterium]|nr:GIY-YIG nuclease family protein [Eubacteriaceae bacterium]
MTAKSDPWHVYILTCSDGTLYTGIAKNYARRLAAHRSGKGAKYTRDRLPVRLEHVECYKTQRMAMLREIEIKAMKRKDKLLLTKHIQCPQQAAVSSLQLQYALTAI